MSKALQGLACWGGAVINGFEAALPGTATLHPYSYSAQMYPPCSVHVKPNCDLGLGFPVKRGCSYSGDSAVVMGISD